MKSWVSEEHLLMMVSSIPRVRGIWKYFGRYWNAQMIPMQRRNMGKAMSASCLSEQSEETLTFLLDTWRLTRSCFLAMGNVPFYSGIV